MSNEPLVKLDANKDSVDLGIVISDWEATKRFYVDILGFVHVADIPFPLGPGGTMHRVQAGSVTLKFTQHNTPPAAQNPPGGPETAVGIRYFTFWVQNLEEIVDRLRAEGYKIPVPVTTIRAGVTISLVEDPDGNWVEFLNSSAS